MHGILQFQHGLVYIILDCQIDNINILLKLYDALTVAMHLYEQSQHA